MRTIVYIDGFNLYYRMLKSRPETKWLDLKAFISRVLHKDHKVHRINYYTARVSARPHDMDAPARQAKYLAALSTIPEVVVHEGSFMISEPWMTIVQPTRILVVFLGEEGKPTTEAKK